MKFCYKCKENKNLLEFNKDKNKKDGLDSQCKSCRAKYNKTKASKSTNLLYTCHECLLPYSAFYLHGYCESCFNLMLSEPKIYTKQEIEALL